jgi:serine protease AprX
MNALKLTSRQRINLTMALLLVSTNYYLYGQEPAYNYFYRIYFRDKGGETTSEYSPLDLLSPRALRRREKAGIPVPDFRDIPVNRSYIDSITGPDLKLHSTSKWMNTALFKSQSAIDINSILDLPFVAEVKIVKTPGKKSVFSNKLDFQIIQADLPPYDRPLTMVNGYPIHDSGYDGKYILIAILDGGFINYDNISSLISLRARNGIKTTYDFVKKNKSVNNLSSHGTAVLSVLAGRIPGQIEGTAPEADFILLKTEDVESEFPCEEDFWAAGAEFADSCGADIISSSLGYFNFDDPSLDYKVSDLDGNTAFVTRVADIAASKGIMVVNSAGNERNSSWKKIIFPADGDSVLAAGAVNADNIISEFSSAGPSAKGSIKPDNVAMGVSVPVQISDNTVGRANGTSFSCPVLSGMAACLLQAVPMAVNSDIIKVLHASGDRFNNPDSLYGYGIPDIVLALNELQNIYTKVPEDGVLVFPNPVTANFEIIFPEPPVNISVELISGTGRLLFRQDYPNYAGRTLIISALQNREQGIYFLRVRTDIGIFVKKLIKIKNQ